MEHQNTNTRGRVSVSLIVWVVLIFVNGIVLLNALIHLPLIGYDAPAQFRYIMTLAKGSLPTPEATYLFYMPPLSYAIPSFLHRTGLELPVVLRTMQILNVVYSILSCLFVLKICNLLRPGSIALKAMALFFMGLLPVYYRTFAFVRGGAPDDAPGLLGNNHGPSVEPEEGPVSLVSLWLVGVAGSYQAVRMGPGSRGGAVHGPSDCLQPG